MTWTILLFATWLAVSLGAILRLSRRKVRGDGPNEAQMRAAAGALDDGDLLRIADELKKNSLEVAPLTAQLLFAAYGLMQKVSVAQMDVAQTIYDLVDSLAVVQFVLEVEKMLAVEIPDFDGHGRFPEGSLLDILELIRLEDQPA